MEKTDAINAAVADVPIAAEVANCQITCVVRPSIAWKTKGSQANLARRINCDLYVSFLHLKIHRINQDIPFEYY